MDWSRAKSILIGAFLLLDLFLGYQVYASRTQQWSDVQQVQKGAGDIELLLDQRNIALKVEIPEEVRQMQYVHVEYLSTDSFGKHPLPTDQHITISDSLITARFDQPIQLNDSTNAAELLRELQKRVMYADQYQPDKYYTERGLLRYWQQYEGLPIFVAPLELFVQRESVIGYQQSYLRIRNHGSGRQVISAYTALRSLLEKQLIRNGETIEDVTMGYYGHEYDADIQVLAPIWRIIHDGKIDYVNAFTGAVERPLDDRASN
ncbi:two-component system regulatory protein YycI [Brevibacillus humidisoli]|uniref:two-component system regulatory protein YycI n=1 Tax=Brevibacillus humidisoli TaxID=2895522 RepID=UPI001E4BC560|nr:two-component system regulatory protein YycI [Brevibacillus humidisoli]UFJ40416.1 two-component system regulatory protein YycI [Brevibacillus humidisoli]